MLLSSNLRKQVKLSFTSKTKIVFNETTEFSVFVSTKDNFNYTLHIDDVKGNIRDLKITPLNGLQNLSCDEANGTYKTNAAELQYPFQFLIECDVEYKIVTPSTWSTEFGTCSDCLKFLNLFECLEGKIPFENYKFYKLQWFIKKVEADFVEFTIKNPHQIQINGQKGDFNLIANVHQDFLLELYFVYDPKVIEMLNKNSENANKAEISTISLIEPTVSSTDSVPKENPILVETLIQKPIVKDIRDLEDEECHAGKNAKINDSVLDENVLNDQHVPSIVSPKVPEKQLNEITSEADKQKDASKPPTKSQNMAEATSFKTGDYVILISSDGKRIFSSASLLIRHSYIFATILKNIKKSPVKINVEEFHSDIIYSALDFLNGKNDAINGKEIELYHFADKYSLRDLKKICCNKFDKLLSLKNVCKIIKIAYENYFEELKLKCIEMIRLNTEKIGESELKTLPTEIYAEIFI
uniref:BTB domain-containing protein n=1 Tax=Panagrolaimus davidi TaxID=227884 RepID=A0A914QPL7_9BILA